ncbi:MAG: LysR family transcriptional regulator, partial [Rhodobacteraceae bacterium]|nr:LysR family transcriptional regulator [Paracoccaceae bacterium]
MGLSAYDLNLRHLRATLEVSRAGGISHASEIVNLSQPAITHAIKTLEDQLNIRLFDRGARGMAATEAGARFAFRIARALEMLNARSQRTSRATLPMATENRVSAAQLRTLVAVADRGSYSAAARAIGAAQPTVHRAARALEARLGQALFQSTANRVTLTRIGERLARNARLAFTEIDLALLDIIETLSEGAGQ